MENVCWQCVKFLARVIHEHGMMIFAVSVFTGFGSWWTFFRARRAWRNRQFLDRVSFSLNVELDGRLWIPAVTEMTIEELFLGNHEAVRIVRAAASATTERQPLLTTIPGNDLPIIMGTVENALEVMTADGSLARSAGLPTVMRYFLVALTCEKGRDIRIRKIRVMVVEEKTLTDLVNKSGDEVACVQFMKAHHNLRMETLRAMWNNYNHLDAGPPKPSCVVRVPLAFRT